MLDRHELETGHYLSGRVRYVNTNGETKTTLKEIRDVRKSSRFWNKFPTVKKGQKLERLKQAGQKIYDIS